MLKKCILFTIFIGIKCFASDYILVLSGGDNPGINNYSQYLQTKTIYNFLNQKYGNENTTVYFGMGNNLTSINSFPDVHQIKDKTDFMLPGVIANNNVASKNKIYNYFFSPHINNIKSTDTLRLFISDHGLPDLFMEDKTLDKYSNNCIDLWNFNGKLVNNFDNKVNFRKVCLSRDELATLLNKVGAKHSIFEMSQCYSGGFHQMSVYLENGYPKANTKICGFTSAMPDHYASGCTANANGPSYQGYERSFTEWYTGISVPTGKVIRKPAISMLSAHQNAILEDKTVDIPISTADYYLLQWASLFDDQNFKSRVNKYSAKQINQIFNDYQQYMQIKNPDLDQFKSMAIQDQALILTRYPQDNNFFNLSMINQKQYILNLEAILDKKQKIIDEKNKLVINLFFNIIYPDWRNAVEKHIVPNLTKKQYQMEKNLYFSVMDNDQLHMPYQLGPLFLQYLAINNNDPEIFNYQKNHFKIIENWAKNKKLNSVVNAIEYDITLENQIDKDYDELNALEQEKQLLKRAYIYRQIIAAWVTLLVIDDKTALADLFGLLKCLNS